MITNIHKAKTKYNTSDILCSFDTPPLLQMESFDLHVVGGMASPSAPIQIAAKIVFAKAGGILSV
jgi:hypothetical protein